MAWWLAAGGVAIVLVVGVLASQTNGGGGKTDPEAFDLLALTGDERVQLASFRGKPVVVNFFASWCDACPFELPAFAEASAELRDDVVFIGVDALETGDGGAMAREFGPADSGFVLARDVEGQQGNGLHAALGGRGMPVTAFYDSDGRLIDFAGGALPREALFERLRQPYGSTSPPEGEAGPRWENDRRHSTTRRRPHPSRGPRYVPARRGGGSPLRGRSGTAPSGWRSHRPVAPPGAPERILPSAARPSGPQWRPSR